MIGTVVGFAGQQVMWIPFLCPRGINPIPVFSFFFQIRRKYDCASNEKRSLGFAGDVLGCACSLKGTRTSENYIQEGKSVPYSISFSLNIFDDSTKLKKKK
jgi:hypothetical protein